MHLWYGVEPCEILKLEADVSWYSDPNYASIPGNFWHSSLSDPSLDDFEHKASSRIGKLKREVTKLSVDKNKNSEKIKEKLLLIEELKEQRAEDNRKGLIVMAVAVPLFLLLLAFG